MTRSGDLLRPLARLVSGGNLLSGRASWHGVGSACIPCRSVCIATGCSLVAVWELIAEIFAEDGASDLV